MGKTYASKSTIFFDVPDPEKIEAKFVYNYFVPDERVNENSQGKLKIRNQKASKVENKSKELEFSDNARYVKIEFSPVIVKTTLGDVGINDLLVNQIAKIQLESNINTFDYRLVTSETGKIVSETTNLIKKLAKMIGAKDEQTDAVKRVTAEIPTIDAALLSMLLSSKSSHGISYVNSSETISANSLSEAIGTSVSFITNRRLQSTMLLGNASKGLSTFFDDAGFSLSEILKDESIVRRQTSNEISPTVDYEPHLIDFDQRPVTTNDKNYKFAIVGYIIDKIEYSPTGEKLKHEPIIIDNASLSQFYDLKIKYGAKYGYTVRTVALVETVIDNVTSENIGGGSYQIRALVSSRSPKEIIVDCVESVAPNPPDGIFYRFNYSEARGLVITWQIPSGRSRDTKYFQIFRRKSIDEGFTCLAEIDFDDSEAKTPRTEFVSLNNRIVMTAPVTYFLDEDFTRDSEYIYAICAVDAHGLTSNYSAQSRVGFDRIKNVITLDLVSQSGAAKQYPNFYIDPSEDPNISVSSLTQDAILDSGRTMLHVYFDPEALSFLSSDGRTGEIISTTEKGAAYKINFVNLDRQKSKTVEIRVDVDSASS